VITVYFRNKKKEVFDSNSYNCQGGFFMIIESPGGGRMITTCIPGELIDRVVIEQNA
jgi:hypothetical protein